jgi:hypothetical protein
MPKIREIRLNPFEFTTRSGVIEGDTVLVQEVGFDNIGLHRKMTHHLMQALLGMERHKSTIEKSQSADQPQTLDGDGNPDDGNDGADQIISMFAMAIDDTAKFEKICDDIQSIMTNRPAIARVAGSDHPLTPAAWAAIGHTNGVQGINRVMSVFSSFFLEGMGQSPAPSQRENGRSELTSSSSPMAVDSIAPMPSHFRRETLGEWK